MGRKEKRLSCREGGQPLFLSFQVLLFPDFDSLKIASFLRFDNQYVIKMVDFSG